MNIRLLIIACTIFSGISLNASLPPQKRVHVDANTSSQTAYQPGTCPICLEIIPHPTAPDIENGEETYGCSKIHLFHHDCIFDHKGSKRCPACPVCGLNAEIITQRTKQHQTASLAPSVPQVSPMLSESPLRNALMTLTTMPCPAAVRPTIWECAVSRLLDSNGTTLSLMLTPLTTPELATIISALPPIIQTSVEHLFVNSTALIALPPEIQFLINVQELSAECNNLTTLPTEIRFLIHLKQLDLHSNQIEKLPHEIGALTQLTGLDIRHNKLKHFPVEIGNLINLEKCYASDNLLENIPDQIGHLQHLQELWLSWNRLETIPLTIQQLTELKTLFLHFNLFSSRTKEVKERLHHILPSLTQLETLELDDTTTISEDLTHARIHYTSAATRAYMLVFHSAHS